MTAFGAAEEAKTNAEVAEDAEVRRGKAKANAMCAMFSGVRDVMRALWFSTHAPSHPKEQRTLLGDPGERVNGAPGDLCPRQQVPIQGSLRSVRKERGLRSR